MGYYLGVSMEQPRAYHGAQGGFLSSIGGFLRNIAQPVLSHINPALGTAYSVARTALSHPVTTAAAGAATGAAVAAASTGHFGGAATSAAPGGMQIHGHLHVGGRRRAAAGLPGRNRRRMNVCNARALRRAIRRAHGFERVARKVLSFTSPHHKPKGHGHFKRARKAR